VRVAGWNTPAPSHWPRTCVKYVCQFVGGGTPDKGNVEYWNGDIPWVSPKDMKSPEITDTEDHLTEAGLDASAARLVQPGNVLLVMRSGILRHSIPIAINRVPTALNQDMRALIPGPSLEARYLARLVEGHQRELLNVWSKEGTTVESLESDLVGNTEIAMPPLSQQRAIADYLDREAVRLDGLVAAKERVLGLLAEKRRAFITRTVTSGLDLHAPLRASGIPWLGEIPSHWDAKRLKFISREITVGIVVTPAKYYASAGVPCLRSLNVREEGLTDSDLVYISDESNALMAKSQIFAGDLVAVRSGQPGTTAVVDGRFDGANCIDLIIIRRSQIYVSEFMAHFLNSQPAKIQFLMGSGGAIQQHFNIETAKDLVVPLPPLEEQRVIVSHIAAETAKLDGLRAATERTVALLRERRAALIAGAVTGQLRIATGPAPEDTAAAVV
jgi:type I restriction enzyme S subunit